MISVNIFEYDKAEGVSLLCGVDEAGRGPLAGDLYAAAVILPEGCIIDGLNDSKKLTEKKRDMLYEQIVQCAVSYSVGIATVEEIDSLNVLQATFLAMQRAVSGLDTTPKLVLVDGNQNPRLNIHTRLVVKGDATSACIAAASIIAKVSRDRYMKEIAEKYPEYQFEKHKGYGTELHYAMLDEYGVSEVHRMTFLKKYLSDTPSPAKARGIIGEKTATDYLLQNGYEITEKNFSCHFGEIDIIARHKDTLIIVEVKARQSKGIATAREAVTKSKQEKIIKSTVYYIQKNAINSAVRFDVLEVYFTGTSLKPCEVNHIKNAFNGDGSYLFI